ERLGRVPGLVLDPQLAHAQLARESRERQQRGSSLAEAQLGPRLGERQQRAKSPQVLPAAVEVARARRPPNARQVVARHQRLAARGARGLRGARRYPAPARRALESQERRVERRAHGGPSALSSARSLRYEEWRRAAIRPAATPSRTAHSGSRSCRQLAKRHSPRKRRNSG